jgi:hypothetical protein
MSGVVVYRAELVEQADGARAAWRLTRLVVEAVARSVAAAEGTLVSPPARRIAVDVLVGGAAVAGELVGQVTSRLTRAARGLGVTAMPALSHLAERGRRERVAAGADLERLAGALVPAITAAVLDRIDLTALVRDRVELDALVAEVDADAVVARVDLDAIAARIDVDAVARRIDLDAIVNRLDLVALANQTVDGMDLSELIRDSTGSVTDDMVRGVRMQGVQADQAVAGFVARLLRRRPEGPRPGWEAPT